MHSDTSPCAGEMSDPLNRSTALHFYSFMLEITALICIAAHLKELNYSIVIWISYIPDMYNTNIFSTCTLIYCIQKDSNHALLNIGTLIRKKRPIFA